MECLNNIINDIIKYASIFTFLMGLIVGNRITISNDRRKEFNDLTLQLRIDLHTQIDNGGRIPVADFSKSYLIDPYISIFRRKAFRKTIDRYKQANKDKSSYDAQSSKTVYNTEILSHIVSLNYKLLTYLKQR